MCVCVSSIIFISGNFLVIVKLNVYTKYQFRALTWIFAFASVAYILHSTNKTNLLHSVLFSYCNLVSFSEILTHKPFSNIDMCTFYYF